MTVSLDRPVASDLSVFWSTEDDNAKAPDDYIARNRAALIFPAGETLGTISIRIVDDAVPEDTVRGGKWDVFFVEAERGPGYRWENGSLTIVEIVDDDVDYGCGNGSSGDAANDALALVDGVTPEVAAAVLLGEQTLSEARLAALDRLGNRNGRYDIGDLLSWIARCRRGEARCGSPSTDSGAASAAMLGAAAAGHRRIPRRRPRRRDSGRRGRCRGRSSMGGIRHRARVAGQVLAILLAATTAWSCTEGGLVGPVAAPPDPGFLTVEWSGPAANRDVGVLLELEGPTIDDVRAPGLELYESSAPGPHRIVVAGVLRPGALVQFRVPDRNRFALYRVRVLAGHGRGLRAQGRRGVPGHDHVALTIFAKMAPPTYAARFERVGGAKPTAARARAVVARPGLLRPAPSSFLTGRMAPGSPVEPASHHRLAPGAQSAGPVAHV